MPDRVLRVVTPVHGTDGGAGGARGGPGQGQGRGTLLFIGGTGGRWPAAGMAVTGALTAALPAPAANLALEVAPVRVSLIAAGFVDTPLSASLLGDQRNAWREELRKTLPIGRVVGPADVAALALHIMANERSPYWRHVRH